MGFRQTVYDLSKTAFDIAGDLKERITYTRNLVSAYDPVTEEETETTTTLTIDVIVINSGAEEREASPVTYYDARILVHADSMNGLTPRETDFVLLAGVRYKVNKVTSPPTNPIFKIYLVRV
jgi:hypothetical protein